MAFDKVTAEDRTDKGVTDLPDTPNMTATELQARFDSLANLAIDSLNNLIDALGKSSAASSIGTSYGTVQKTFTTHKGYIDTLLNRMSTAETKIKELSTDASDMDEIQTELVKVKSDINALNNSLIDKDERISDNETDITSLKSYVYGDGTKEYTETIRENVDENTLAIEELQDDSANHANSIAAIKKQIGDAETVDTIVYDLLSANLTATDAYHIADTNKDSITTLQTSVRDNSESIRNLQTFTNNLDTNYDALDNYTTDTRDMVEEMQTAIDSILKRLTALEGGTTA